MNKAEELFTNIKELTKDYSESEWIKKARESTNPYDNNQKFYDGASNYGDHMTFYRWLATLVKTIKPMKLVEFGALYGGSAAFMLSEMQPEAKLYSVDCKKEPWLWQYVPKWEKRLKKIPGVDCANFLAYPDNFKWDNVDLWFIDSTHNSSHVSIMMEKIVAHKKKGAIVLNHDAYVGGTEQVLKDFHSIGYVHYVDSTLTKAGVGITIL